MNQYNTLPKNAFPGGGRGTGADRQNTWESRSPVPHVPAAVSEFPYWRSREG